MNSKRLKMIESKVYNLFIIWNVNSGAKGDFDSSMIVYNLFIIWNVNKKQIYKG